MANILVIDDDLNLCEIVCSAVSHMGHMSSCAVTIKDGIRVAKNGNWDVVFLDVKFPDGSGLDALPVIRSIPSRPEVIIFTGQGDPDGAKTAIQSGAYDYVEKPSSLDAMILPLMRALEYRAATMKDVKPLPNSEGILGQSPEMKECFGMISNAAKSDKEVLIVGETGTGKELFARAVHSNSRRSSRDFIIVDCAALPETLAESILFGHEKGAFTSAGTARDGLIKQADGGTLFLDEIGDLPLSLQKNFLRVLQEKTFRPLGSQRELKSEFRLVAATNRDLDKMVREGLFREDLLFRIKSWLIPLPPLKKRNGDIVEIALHFVANQQKTRDGGRKGFSPEFTEALTVYHWPGNVRELLTALEIAIEMSQDGPRLYHNHLPAYIRVHVAAALLRKERSARRPSRINTGDKKKYPSLKKFRSQRVAAIEKEYLLELMDLTGGDTQEACGISGISRSRLYGLLKEHGLIVSV